jgi:ribosome assembly protein RRB1
MMSEQKEKEKKEKGKKEEKAVFLGSNKNLGKGEVLEFDNRAYEMLHRLNVEWPSMSIDFVARSSPFDSAPVGFQKL